MPRVLRCPSLVFLAFALLSLGCSRKLPEVPTAGNENPILQTENGITKEFVREVGYRPVISGQISRESTIDVSLSCIQWVTLSDGKVTLDALEFHQAACPNDGTALEDTSLAFRTLMTSVETADWGSTYKLYRLKEDQEVHVGQVQLSNAAGARLEDLCQFTNGTTGTAPYANTCTVSETSKSWGAINFVTPVAEPSAPIPAFEPEEEVEDSTSPALVRR